MSSFEMLAISSANCCTLSVLVSAFPSVLGAVMVGVAGLVDCVVVSVVGCVSLVVLVICVLGVSVFVVSLVSNSFPESIIDVPTTIGPALSVFGVVTRPCDSVFLRVSFVISDCEAIS